MADNITIPATGSGTATPVVATDDAGAAGHVQLVKLAVSADGSATALTADNTSGVLSNPSDRALRDCGKIDVAALDQYTPVSGRLPVDGSGVTQPISGTVTVTATNLDVRDLTHVSDSVRIGDGTDLALVSAGGALLVDASATTQPISAASLPLPTGAATSAAQLPDGHNVTVDNAAGAAAVNIQDGGNAITVDGTVTANATLSAETTKVIGTVRCIGNAGAVFDAATAAAVPANAILNGAKACITNPTAVTNAQLVGVMTDDVGRLVTVGGHVRDLVGVQTTTIASSAAETTVITAIASTFLDITSLSLTNATATAVSATLKDATAGTTRAIYDLAANGGIVLTFDPPLPQAASNNNWTITLSAATVTVHINAVFVKNV